jgi:hypothetical protein
MPQGQDREDPRDAAEKGRKQDILVRKTAAAGSARHSLFKEGLMGFGEIHGLTARPAASSQALSQVEAARTNETARSASATIAAVSQAKISDQFKDAKLTGPAPGTVYGPQGRGYVGILRGGCLLPPGQLPLGKLTGRDTRVQPNKTNVSPVWEKIVTSSTTDTRVQPNKTDAAPSWYKFLPSSTTDTLVQPNKTDAASLKAMDGGSKEPVIRPQQALRLYAANAKVVELQRSLQAPQSGDRVRNAGDQLADALGKLLGTESLLQHPGQLDGFSPQRDLPGSPLHGGGIGVDPIPLPKPAASSSRSGGIGIDPVPLPKPALEFPTFPTFPKLPSFDFKPFSIRL